MTTTEQLAADASAFLLKHYQQTNPGAQAEINLKPLSSRVKLARCNSPVQFSTKNTRGGRVSLRAGCSKPRWQLYLGASVRLIKPVIIADNLLSKGQIIRHRHLRIAQRDTANLQQSYFSDTRFLIGKAAKRNIKAGQVIKSSMLTAATLINKGDSVIIEARRGGLVIRTAGAALQSGKKRQQISVRNEKSGRTIKAVVIAPGLVRTP
ncbi:MAG: flagellar basal body P-ring formation chaperone FlgA [Pontibacterium sp.]